MIIYNDYELIYLARKNNQYALGILFKKYEPLIEKKLNDFSIRKSQKEDFKQECIMVINKVIYIYDMHSIKTFHRFLELCIERKIMNLLKSCSKDAGNHLSFYDCGEVLENLESSTKDVLTIMIEQEQFQAILDLDLLPKRKEILSEIMIEKNMSVQEYAKKNGMKDKDVYNQVYLIRSYLRRSIDIK